MRKIVVVLFFINLFFKIHSQEGLCKNQPDKKNCIKECLIGPIIKYAFHDNNHLYYFKINEYKADSIVSFCIKRICNKNDFDKMDFNGFVRWNRLFVLLYKDNNSDKFVKDFGIDKINDDARKYALDRLFDNSKSRTSFKDEYGSNCICDYEYDYLKDVFVEKCKK
jgi:hypothetical protein